MLKILNLEDNLTDSELMAATLSSAGIDCEIHRVETGQDFIEALGRDVYDLIISDFSLPSFDGRRALDVAKQTSPGIPFIFFSGTIGEDSAIESLLNGATDYVLKTKLSRLVPAVKRAIEEGENRKAREGAEEALRLQTSYFRQLFENSPVGIALLDTGERVVNINKSFQNMFQYDLEEIRGKVIDDFIVPPDHLEEARKLTFESQRDQTVQRETIRKKRDGSRVDVTVIGYPILINSELVGTYALYVDITDRKRLEEQLRQAQKLESMGTLAGGIAHDFNNILGIILGHLSIIERSEGEPGVISKNAAIITQTVQRGAGLVRQILTFARKTDVDLHPLNVNESIEELYRMIREVFPKTIEITLRLNKKVPIITMDHTQLHQTLLNLCINARDAMIDLSPTKVGEGKLTLRTESIRGSRLQERFPDASAAEYVSISVSDTGTGMDEATRQRIFEPFFTTKEVGKGTGLGLAVVHGVVKSHGGFVELESEVGHGTTFNLYFPVPANIVEDKKISKLEASEVRGGTETILLVEDEENLRSMMKLLLEEKGYDVLEARDGIEAIQQFTNNKEKIALVLTDMGLPKLDGAAVLSTLRETDPKVKVVLASGYIDPAVRSELINMGQVFIQKPYEPNDVLNMIREILDRK